MSTYNGIPFNGGMDSPSGTGAQNIVETCQAIADWLVFGGNPAQLWDHNTPSPMLSADWHRRALYYPDGTTISVDWENAVLRDASANEVMNWGSSQLQRSGVSVLDWYNAQLNDTYGNASVDAQSRRLSQDDGTAVVDWSNGFLLGVCPTADPHVPNQIYRLGDALMISNG